MSRLPDSSAERVPDDAAGPPPAPAGDGLGTTASRGAAVTLAAQGVRLVLQVGSLVVLARLLTPAQFGLVAMVTAITGIAEILRDFGLSSAAIQAKNISHAERSNLFWVNVGIGTVAAAAAAALSGPIGAWYGQPEIPAIVLVLAPLMIVSGATTQFRADLSRSMRFTALARTDITAQVASIAVAIVAAALGAGYWSIVAQQGAFVIATFVMSAAQSRLRPSWYRRGVSLRRFFRFGGGLLGMQLLGYTTNNVDTAALGAVWGPSQVGIYGRAYQLLIVPLNQVANALLRVMLPVLSKVQDDDERFLAYVRRAQLICGYGFGGAFSLAAGLAVPLVAVLFGPGWDGVAPVFAILAIGGVFRGLAQVTYWITLAKGLTGSQLRFYLMARPFMILCLLAGLPWGAVGVAVGHTVAFSVEWLASFWWVGRASGLSIWPLAGRAVRIIGLVCLPAGAAAYAGTLLPLPTGLRLLAGIACAAVLLAVVMTVSRRERADLKEMLEFGRRAVKKGAS
ncbi:MAG: lipopolysaccharide biosynthesis protein [Nakamurella sp.]